MKILITGSNGLLGQKLVNYCITHEISFCATSFGSNRNPDCPEEHYRSMDIREPKVIQSIFDEFKPSHVIHTAAMTNVDACEKDPQCCFEVNTEGTAHLVDEATRLNAHFQLLSTDFVFDGSTGNYSEKDSVNPLSEYAKSKVEAEKYVMEHCGDNWSIVRTIIVYGSGNNLSRSNIIAWAKGMLEKKEELKIVDDQFRAPTFAEDLAAGCMAIIERELHGVFHISGPETMSIHQLVVRIAQHFGYDDSRIRKISSAELNQPAKRPPHTGFDLGKAYKLLGYKPHTLEESLDIMYAVSTEN